MEPSSIGVVPLPPVSHMGVVVRDVDKTVAFLSSTFGIGPWQIREMSRSQDEVRVGEGPYKVKVALTTIGSLNLELVQPIEGRTMHSRFLEARGEGLEHIGFRVPNMDEVVSKLQQHGMRIRQSYVGQTGYAYMDSPETGGIIFEITQARG